jgi:hypothetical protein
MSVKQRRAKQREEQAAAAAAAAAAQQDETVPASAVAEPTPSSAPTLTRASTSVTTPLLASLHSLYRTPLIPEFTEIRAAAGQGSEDSGVFYIGRLRAAKVDGVDVKVDLVLQTTNAKLSKMISRVHAKITWTRSLLPPPASKGRKGKAAAAAPSYSYAWAIHDLASVNGIFVNSVKLSSSTPHPLSPEDRIVFGGGAGIEPGTYHKARAEDAEFVFRFNCKTKDGPAADEGQSEPLEEIHEEPAQQPQRVYSTVRKVALKRGASKNSTSSSSSPSLQPASKRQRSLHGRSVIPEGDESASESDASRSGSPAPMDPAAEEGATQDAGSSAFMADSGSQHGGSTQDYHDADRDAERHAAGAGATQDFGGGDAEEHTGTATQDGAGMLE